MNGVVSASAAILDCVQVRDCSPEIDVARYLEEDIVGQCRFFFLPGSIDRLGWIASGIGRVGEKLAHEPSKRFVLV